MARPRRASTLGLGRTLGELSIAAPQVVAIRTSRMLAAGHMPSSRDRTEWGRMHAEKAQAAWEAASGLAGEWTRLSAAWMRTAAMQWWRVWLTPWWTGPMRALPGMSSPFGAAGRRRTQRAAAGLLAASLAPMHRLATANARRLGGSERTRSGSARRRSARTR